jgi:hypothetical protein
MTFGCSLRRDVKGDLELHANFRSVSTHGKFLVGRGLNELFLSFCPEIVKMLRHGGWTWVGGRVFFFFFFFF